MTDPSEHDWWVKRLDDNGNEFVMQGGLTRTQAERLAADYQARGHKQSYWPERMAPTDHSLRR